VASRENALEFFATSDGRYARVQELDSAWNPISTVHPLTDLRDHAARASFENNPVGTFFSISPESRFALHGVSDDSLLLWVPSGCICSSMSNPLPAGEGFGTPSEFEPEPFSYSDWIPKRNLKRDLRSLCIFTKTTVVSCFL
jgi:hypothetical protein